MGTSNKYVTVAELAKMLNISRQAVFKRVKSGEIKAIEKGKSYLIEKDSLSKEILEEIEKKKKEAVNQAMKSSGKDLEFEKELWKAADRLRGSMDAGEYKT